MKLIYDVCLDVDVKCPNECSVSLKHREIEDHIETDCLNTLVSCPFSRFERKELVKRYEQEEHRETKESKHTQLQLNFALTKIFVMKEKRKKVEKRYADYVAELKDQLAIWRQD